MSENRLILISTDKVYKEPSLPLLFLFFFFAIRSFIENDDNKDIKNPHGSGKLLQLIRGTREFTH